MILISILFWFRSVSWLPPLLFASLVQLSSSFLDTKSQWLKVFIFIFISYPNPSASLWFWSQISAKNFKRWNHEMIHWFERFIYVTLLFKALLSHLSQMFLFWFWWKTSWSQLALGVPEGFLANGLEWWARNPLHLSLLPPFHHDHLSNLVHLHSPHQAIKKHRDQKQKMQNLPKAEWTQVLRTLTWLSIWTQIFILPQSYQYLQKRLLLEKVVLCRTANLCSNQTHI